ncbi:MAG: sel1 repeat family protein [Magnetococcales bacterium]|nr:sel1 repeat family protein [Magnetococcales bacterium]
MIRFAPSASRLVPIVLLLVAMIGYAGGNDMVCHAAEQGVDALIQAAKQGSSKAQRRLGQIFHDGKGVQRDYGEAMRWFRLAADQGDAEAQNGVGTLYDNGKGVPKDYHEAARWFRLAADQGHVLARRNLGWMYEKGQGFKRDYVLSYMWQYLAEKARIEQQGKSGGGVDQCRLCDAVARKMTPEQVARAQERAREWSPKGP